MNKILCFVTCVVLIGIPLMGCTAMPIQEPITDVATQEATETLANEIQESELPTGSAVEQQEIIAKTPRLTLKSTSEEIREKMLSSFLNWQTMEVQSVWENNSLNPDNSIAYTVKYEINTWIDQDNLRFRTEEQQVDADVLPKLAISDGIVMVSRDAPRIVEGYPNRAPATHVYRVIAGNSDEETLNLLYNGETIFSPMGEAYSGEIKSELFSSSYAVQYPGNYEGMEIESIAGRETLKVFYGDANRWGGSNIQYTLWIDTETGVVLKVWADGTPDHFTESMEITQIAYNVPVDEKKFNTEEALPDLNLSEMESDTVDGNTIYADNLRVVEDQIALDICYELPTDADWMAFDMTADGKTQINPNGFLIYMEQAGTFHTKGLRCYLVSFPYTLEDRTLHFEIGQLFAPAREGEGCTPSDLVSRALEEAGTPIEYTCVEDHGMIISEILSKPDTMTEEEARTKVYELFVQFRNESLPGPWVFDLRLQDERLSAIESAAPDLNIKSMQNDTVDGYTIYTGNLAIDGDQVTLDVCYDLPSNSQWMLHDILVEGKVQSNIFGHGLYMEPAGTFQEKGFRCDEATFRHALEDDVLNFEVGQLYSAAREGDPCDVSDLVSQDLVDAGTPVEFSCVAQSGVAKTEILTWSDRLTKEEARIRVEALFEQYRVETLSGPWVFEIPVEQE